MNIHIHLIPEAAPEWTPDSGFVRKLLIDCFKSEHIYALGIFSRPEYWDDDPEERGAVRLRGCETIMHCGEDPAEIRSESNISTEVGLAILEATRGVYKFVDFKTEWTTQVQNDFRGLPGCFPCLHIGTSSIPALGLESTAACTNCRLSFSGVEFPKDWQKHLEAVKRHPSFISVQQFVERQSGIEWKFLFGY